MISVDFSVLWILTLETEKKKLKIFLLIFNFVPRAKSGERKNRQFSSRIPSN